MTTMSPDTIVLSGCGWVTPFTEGTIPDVLASIASDAPEPESGSSYWAVPDDRIGNYPDLTKEIRLDKGAWLTAISTQHAIASASLDLSSRDMTRVGLILGCGLAGQYGMLEFANEVRGQSPRFVSPIHFPQTVGNYVAAAIARGYGLRGPNITHASGMASGLHALIEAYRMIESSTADILFAGGTEHLSESLAEGFGKSGAMLSEGSCLFVVERLGSASARGVKPLASLSLDTTSQEDTVVSVAGSPQIGGVHIEAAIGRCIGAAGASAVAAAIGAMSGIAVPISKSADSTVAGAITDRPEKCVIRAGLEGEQSASLALCF